MSHPEAPRPRLCLVVTQAGWGGAQRYVFDLAVALRERFDITIAAGEAAGDGELLRRARAAHLFTHCFHHLRRKIRPLDDLLAIFEMAQFFRAGRFQLIHTNSSKADVLGALAARLASSQLPVVSTIHGWVFLEPLAKPCRLIYIALERLAAARRRATIVLSESERAAAIREKITSPEQLSVIPLGLQTVTMASRAEARRDLGLAPDARVVVGSIANLYATKGIDVLLAAAPDVLAAFPDATFVVIGEGPLRVALERLRDTLVSPDRFLFIGKREGAARLLPAFDVFVLPSRKEGIPYTILEAMTAGVPLIATTVGGVPEVVTPERDGLLVPPGNPKALSGAIARTLTDAHLAAQRVAAARARRRDFSLELMVSRTAALYDKLLHAVSGPPGGRRAGF